MPSDDSLKDARVVAQQIAHEDNWRDFAAYCDLRARGLRKPALAALRRFVTQAESWSFAERRRFTAWLVERATHTTMELDGRLFTLGVLLPQPVLEGVIRPTLQEWREREAQSVEPFLWSALLYDPAAELQGQNQEFFFRQALRVDPECERARKHLINLLMGYVEYPQHHLPEGYLGDAEVGLEYLREARLLLLDVRDEEYRRATGEQLEYLDDLTRDWMSFSEAGGDDFERWCEEQSKRYPWSRTYYYQ